LQRENKRLWDAQKADNDLIDSFYQDATEQATRSTRLVLEISESQRDEGELFSLQYQFQALQMKIENLRYANALEQKLAILEKRCTGFVEKIEFWKNKIWNWE
jgi:hypothetical protein